MNRKALAIYAKSFRRLVEAMKVLRIMYTPYSERMLNNPPIMKKREFRKIAHSSFS